MHSNLPTLVSNITPLSQELQFINKNYFHRFCSTAFTRRGFLEEEDDEDAAVVAVER